MSEACVAQRDQHHSSADVVDSSQRRDLHPSGGTFRWRLIHSWPAQAISAPTPRTTNSAPATVTIRIAIRRPSRRNEALKVFHPPWRRVRLQQIGEEWQLEQGQHDQVEADDHEDGLRRAEIVLRQAGEGNEIGGARKGKECSNEEVGARGVPGSAAAAWYGASCLSSPCSFDLNYIDPWR